MIELPEAIVLSKEIDEALSGKQIKTVVAGHSPHKFAFFHPDEEDFQNLIVNSFITRSYNQGGFVRVELSDDKNLLFSEGVRMRYLSEGELLPKKHQLLIEFTDASSLVCSVQMYGFFAAFKKDDYDNKYVEAAKTKASPLSDEFNEAYFLQLIANSSDKLSLKAFLATEQRIPGLGNGVLQDILFNAKLHPKKKLNSLDDKEKEKLFDSIKTTLQKMVDGGGRDTEQDIFGYPGNYKSILSKNTVGKPCPECNSLIQKQAYMGGSIYFCPTCQEL